jgi:adenylate cyclase
LQLHSFLPESNLGWWLQSEDVTLPSDTRRLAAIVSADIVGFSRLMGQDETGMLATLNAITSEHVRPLIQSFGGRMVKEMGDGFLIEFLSVVSAAKFGCTLQDRMVSEGGGASARFHFRIGINLGDVIVQAEDVFGDGVNIASRLQEIAVPGGVAVSQSVYEHLDEDSAVGFQDQGEYDLKNIRRPIRVWQWSPEELKAAGRSALKQTRSSPPGERRSIAVLPFKNLSGELDQEYFADGLTEDILTAISHLHTFPVIARSSVFSFKGQRVRMEDVAKVLGARYILDGSVRMSGSRMRISVNLADAEFGHQLWAERFDRDLEDIFDLQDEITRKVAAIFGPQIEQAEIMRASQKSNSEFTTWDFIAKGLPHFHEHTCVGNARAREYFSQAVDADENYSDAWAYLGWSYSRDILIGCPVDPALTGQLGFEAARRAVSLDDNSAVAHLALGSIYIWTGDVDSGLRHGQRALELNPNDVRAGLAVGNRLTLIGRLEEGIRTILATLPLNPRDPSRWLYYGYLSRSYLELGDIEAATEWAKKAIDMRQDQADAYFRVAICHAHRGEVEVAGQLLAKAELLEPGFLNRRRSWQPFPDPRRNHWFLAPLRDNGLL